MVGSPKHLWEQPTLRVCKSAAAKTRLSEHVSGELPRKEMLPNAQADPTLTQNRTSGVLHEVLEKTVNRHSSA